MSLLSLIIVVVLVLLLVGGLPGLSWGYGARLGGGYGPSGLVTVLIVIVVILALTGRL